MKNQMLRLAGAAAAVLLAAAPMAAAQPETGTLRVTDLPAGASIEYAVNGVKPARSSAVASDAGVAEFTLNFTDMSKPTGFKGTLYVDSCPGGVLIHVVESGAPPAPGPDCDRRRRGTAEFRPDRVTTFAAAPPVSPLPLAGLGGGFATDTADMTFTKSLEIWGGRVGTSALPEERSTEVPGHFENELELNASAPDFVIPLPRMSRGPRNAAFGAATGAAPGGGPASRLVAHHAIVSIGRGEATLDYRNTESPADSTRWTGSGTLWGLGYGAAVELCSGCRWVANTSYVYSQMQRSDMHRSSKPLDLEGGRLLREDASFEWNAHTLRFTVGRATEHVFPYAGIRAARRAATLEGKVDIDYSGLFGGLPVEQNISFVNEFEKTTVQGVFGAQVRLPGTRLFVRAEGTAGGGASGFGVSAGYGWYK